MTKTRRTFPEPLKREAVEQVLAGTPLRHVAQAFDITESLLGKWKRQFQDAGPAAFPGRGKQSGEAAELKRLRDELARVTMERDVLKNHPWGHPAPSRRAETPHHYLH
ncbi:transposase [Vogesella indigofera]|uniref:transposase n=1 Tax=Vogesella indigofera TaxID=45465 RepID=UPI003F41F315